MKFPSYIPTAAQLFFVECVEGAQPLAKASNIPAILASYGGLQSLLSATQQKLVDLESELTTADRTQHDVLLRRRELALRDLKRFKRRLARLQHLATDPRMRSAYPHLIRDFDDDAKYRVFFRAALEALEDQEQFASRRADLKRAKKLDPRIAKTAKILATLLSERNKLSIIQPDEYSNPRRDSLEFLLFLENQQIGLRAMNELHVTGHSPDGAPHKMSSKRNRAVHAREALDNFLNMLWQSSQYDKLIKDLSAETVDIIRGIAFAAQNCTPKLYGATAATQTNKNHRKMQYLRAFWYLIYNNPSCFRQIVRTPGLTHAMAITASVVLNDPDDDVTYDDVRKALEDRGKPSRKNVPARRKI
jgi:hypothetical protein